MYKTISTKYKKIQYLGTSIVAKKESPNLGSKILKTGL